MEDVIFPISKSDLVKIWKHSRNKIKTDYWVRDAQARLATKYRNDMVQEDSGIFPILLNALTN